MELSQPEKIAVLKRIFNEDIEEFGKFFFPNHIKLKTPKFHREIYKLYQSELKKIGICAPRGHSKSTITDLVYLAWAIVHNKAKFILLISDTYSQAVLFLDALKAELEANDLLIQWYGKLTSDSWSEGEIITNKIMIKALGAGMKVRGLKYHESRPDLVVVDDLENDELVDSRERRQKLEHWFNGALIPAMARDGRIVIIGTILHYDSLLYKIMNGDAYGEFERRMYRAIQEDGTALWPEHLNLDELEQIKREYLGKGQGYIFYQEYQNEPISAEDRKFKVEKVKYFEESNLDGKLLNNYITVDRAYSTEKTADWTGIIVNSVDVNNNWYVREAIRFKGEETALIDLIFNLNEQYRALKTGFEQKAYKYTFEPTLKSEMARRNTFFSIVELKDLQRRKELRIEGLLPRWETGTIYLKREHTDLLDELIKFPKALHDDLSDALAYQNELAQAPRSGITQKNYVVEEYDTGEYGLN